MRTLRHLAPLSLLLLAACPGAQTRPTSMRELLATDVNDCFIKAKQYGNPALAGQATLQLLVADDGAVPAAWIHDVERLDSSTFFGCLGRIGTISKFEGQKIDYVLTWLISCEGTSCQKQALSEIPKKPLDARWSAPSLTFADWASQTDKGWGYYEVQKYPESIAAFNEALKATPGDVRAMRGLAQALAESGGDLKQARELADKAVTAQPNSAAALESRLRVCMKQKDDECTAKSFLEATKGEDVKTRSIQLSALYEDAKTANSRLEESEKKKEEETRAKQEANLAKVDPAGCYKMEGDGKAACYVRRCFEAGAKEYANDLKKVTGQEYNVGEWVTSKDAAGNFLVTVTLRSGAAAKAAKKGKKAAPVAGGDHRDATWLVVLGDQIDMKPYKENLSAYNIAKDHNACK